MEKFEFLIGDWTLKYTVPKSVFSIEAKGTGEGTFSRALNNKYVFFDYRAELTTGSAQAHGIFAKDEKLNIYRYWWFEDSGNFQSGACNFINDKIFFMNWHETSLIQTFELLDENTVMLKMSHPLDADNFEPILKVELFRK
ncbi:MAG: hypothetical protein P8184_19225 [Calditrichia bacterium]